MKPSKVIGVGLLAAVVCTGMSMPAGAADMPVKAGPAAVVAKHWFIDASVDGVYARHSSRSSAILVEDTVTGAPIMLGSQVDYPDRLGLDARLRIGSGAWSIEGRYFGGFRWRASAAGTTTPIWNFPTNPPLFGLGVAQIQANRDGRFDSAEANLRYQISPHVVLFVGARWVETPDNLVFNADFGGNAATIAWRASSKALGPQVGFDARVFGPGTPFNPFSRVFLDVDARAALLRSKADAFFSVNQAIGPAFTSAGSSTRNTVMYEVGAALGVQVTPNVELRGGYRYLDFAGAVLSPDLIVQTDVVNTLINTNQQNLRIQAATFGIRAKFP
jgi:opacity protein-like surface antigen